ncbi:MAG: hypothetical protein PVF22_07015 [Candidatus Aminicenantes bacterium]
MRLVKYVTLSILILGLLPDSIRAEDSPIEIQGTYLAYSYDFNQIYGENLQFYSDFCTLSSDYLKVDISSRLFMAGGNVVVEKDGQTFRADVFVFNPSLEKGSLIRYGEKIEIKEIGEEEGATLSTQISALDDLNLTRINKSFISFTGQHFEINDKYDVFGYDVTLYIEGIESVGLKKFKLSEGIRQKRNGPYLDKIWYNRAQGIIAQAGLLFEKENTINSLTQIYYEEHSILKNYSGLKRQVDLMTSTSLLLNKGITLGISGNYNSSSQWNTRFALDKDWGGKGHAQLDFTYNKPLNRDQEAWMGLETALDGGKFGKISLSARYEFQNQILANFTYSNLLLNKVNFQLTSSYSKLKIGDSSDYSKIFTGNVRLSYGSKIFNLSTDYYLNHDLFGNQLLSQPQLRFGLNTFSFYDNLLSASVTNVFIYNRLRMDEVGRNSYSNNTIFNLSSQPIYIRKSLSLNFNLAVEQFLEKEGRNFTSGGFIFNAKKILVKGVTFEGIYSFQSRRKTKNWFIEGTTSQDLSAILRINPTESINSWISVSYDPKNNQWRQSFADISITFFKTWTLHSLLNYDFLQKKLNNVDLYLIRDSGRFQIRLIWRSLSKQFLIELIPK